MTTRLTPAELAAEEREAIRLMALARRWRQRAPRQQVVEPWEMPRRRWVEPSPQPVTLADMVAAVETAVPDQDGEL
jgi:hypothetical protein